MTRNDATDHATTLRRRKAKSGGAARLESLRNPQLVPALVTRFKAANHDSSAVHSAAEHP